MITTITQAAEVARRRFARLGTHREYVRFAVPTGRDEEGNDREATGRAAVPFGSDPAKVAAAILRVHKNARILRTERVRRRDLPAAVRRFLRRKGLKASDLWECLQREAA